MVPVAADVMHCTLQLLPFATASATDAGNAGTAGLRVDLYCLSWRA